MNFLKVRQVSSLEKVFPDQETLLSDHVEAISGLWGEDISFQMAYRYDSPSSQWVNVRVISELKGYIRVRKVELVPSRYPCHVTKDKDYLRTNPGMFPDLLRDIRNNKIKLIPRQWRSLWIDISLTKKTPLGTYPVKIEIIDDEGFCIGETETLVEVIGISLPKLRLKHTEWFHGDCLADYYRVDVFSEKHWEIMENFIETASKRNCNMILVPIFTPPLDTEIGGERTTIQLVDVFVKGDEYDFDFSKLRRFIHICQDKGIQYFEMAHLFTQWGAKAAPKIMAMVDGEYKQIFGWDTPSIGGKYETFLKSFLPALTEKLKNWDLKDYVFFHISDEPNKEHIESYAKAKELVYPYLDGFGKLDALSDYEFYKHGLVEQPVCANNHIEPFLNNKVENLWAYYCTSQYEKVANRFMSMPSYRNRIYGVQIYKYNITGILHWGYNFYNSQYSTEQINPYENTDASESFPSGDSFLVYPGADGKPEESIRIMVLNEALNDYRAMQLLEEISGRDKVLELIQKNTTSEITFSEYPRTTKYLLELRTAINQEIKKVINEK